MNDNVYVLDLGASYLLVDLNSLCHCTIEKQSFTKETVQRVLDNELQDQRPFFTRLSPDNLQPDRPDMVIVTSFHCNYACQYCYQEPSKGMKDRLLPEDVPSILSFWKQYSERYAIPLRFGEISIVGGEPLLEENRCTIQAVSDLWPDSPLMFTTNGANLPAYADFLLSRRVHVRVSLDGTKETHYSRRKTVDPFAYDRAIDGIRLLLQYEKDITILTVFSPAHLPDYPRFFDLLEDLGWLHTPHLKVAFLPEIGCGSDDISLDSIRENLEAFQLLRRTDPRAVHVNAWKLLPGSLAFACALYRSDAGFYNPYRCAFLHNSSYSFFPDGSVRGCLLMQSDSDCIGHFLPEVSINEAYIQRLSERRVDRLENCKECPQRVLCLGGCPATARKILNDAAAPYCGFWKSGNFLSYYEMIMGGQV